MRKKKKHEEEEVAADQMEMATEEVASPEKVDETLKEAGAESVKRPELKGHKKPKFEQPGTNNQSRKVIE